MDGCVEHTQRPGKQVYGNASHEGRQMGMHRRAYLTAHGLAAHAIDGLVVRHTCDNRRCINPNHLELGTQKENIGDMWERGRAVSNLPPPRPGVEHHNARLTPEDVAAIRAGQGKQRDIARMYGLSEGHVSKIRNGERWR